MDWLIGLFVAKERGSTVYSGEDDIVFTSMKILSMLDVRCIRGADETHHRPSPISNIRQSEKWDCGLACLQMVHRWLCQPNNSKASDYSDVFKTERQWIRDLVATKSVWTPDLVNALDRMRSMSGSSEEPFPKMSNFSYLYCTTKLGVDTSFEDLDYYRESFQCDETRVKSLLEHAKRRGLPMVQVSRLCFEEFAEVISHSEVVAIVLVDNHVLTKGPCERSANSTYRGHYILVSGISYREEDVKFANVKSFDDREYCMVVKNPGVTVETEFVSPKRFEEAWRAVGTDEDVIFIAKH